MSESERAALRMECLMRATGLGLSADETIALAQRYYDWIVLA